MQATLSSRERLAFRPSVRASKGILYTRVRVMVMIKFRVSIRVRVIS